MKTGSVLVARRHQCFPRKQFVEFLLNGIGKAQPATKLQLGFQFAERTPSDTEKAQILAFRETASAFRDVGRNADRRPAHLQNQTELLGLGEGGGQRVDDLSERHRILPNIQSMMAAGE